MGIRFFNREFKPSWLMTLISVAAFTLFCVLGLWQLQRADLKREIQQRYQTQLSEPYQFIRLDDDVNPLLQYKKVELRGRFAPQFTLLLDNQLFNQQVGYHVITPFFINKQQAVLVDRGWVALGENRRVLPQIQAPKQMDRVQGIVTIPSTNGFRMGQVVLDGSWPTVIPFIDLKKIRQGVDFDVLPYVIWQAEEVDDVYPRHWKPVWSLPERSDAYAVQWFSFAVITLFLFIKLNLKPVGESNV